MKSAEEGKHIFVNNSFKWGFAYFHYARRSFIIKHAVLWRRRWWWWQQTTYAPAGFETKFVSYPCADAVTNISTVQVRFSLISAVTATQIPVQAHRYL